MKRLTPKLSWLRTTRHSRATLNLTVRNALADPYILGINSGASTGAALAILFGVGAGFGEYALQGAAFIGALAASAVMFFIARSAGRLTSVRLLMAGIAVGYALSAVTSFLIFASDSAEGSRSVMFWLLGSLGPDRRRRRGIDYGRKSRPNARHPGGLDLYSRRLCRGHGWLDWFRRFGDSARCPPFGGWLTPPHDSGRRITGS